MINQGNDVPDRTIAVFTENGFPYERLKSLINKPGKKREWFTPHFYNCLPLVIGNQYGYIVTSEWGFSVTWHGTSTQTGIVITPDEPKNVDNLVPRIASHFGEGILTIEMPIVFRTPPGVNIMTINPPNYIVENMTVMTGVIETDNIRRKFTFNLKIQTPNKKVHYPAGTPLAAFIPIPRYFADFFTIRSASEIFPNNLVQEEEAAAHDAYVHRMNIEPELPNHLGRHYFRGVDIYDNPFPDHQRG